jgi:hypothetical protein
MLSGCNQPPAQYRSVLDYAGVFLDGLPQPADMDIQRAGITRVFCIPNLGEQRISPDNFPIIFHQHLQDFHQPRRQFCLSAVTGDQLSLRVQFDRADMQ